MNHLLSTSCKKYRSEDYLPSLQKLLLGFIEKMINLSTFAAIKTDQEDAITLVGTIMTSHGLGAASQSLLTLNIHLGNSEAIAEALSYILKNIDSNFMKDTLANNKRQKGDSSNHQLVHNLFEAI